MVNCSVLVTSRRPPFFVAGGRPEPRGVLEHHGTARAAASRVDDAALVRAAQKGDHVAFAELVRLYDHSVLRLALNLVRSEQEAHDIYQEAFLRIYRSLSSFRFQCSFYTWVYRIVTNLCLDHLRKASLRREETAAPARLKRSRWMAPARESEGGPADFFEQVEDLRADGHPERDLLRREMKYQIECALKRLSPRERMVFEMKHYHGLKLRTIGEMLQTSEQTAKNCLFRATQKLRGSLQKAL